METVARGHWQSVEVLEHLGLKFANVKALYLFSETILFISHEYRAYQFQFVPGVLCLPLTN